MSEKKNLGKVCLALQVWGYLLTCPSFLVLTLGRFSLGFLESSRSRNYLKPSFEAKFGDFNRVCVALQGINAKYKNTGLLYMCLLCKRSYSYLYNV